MRQLVSVAGHFHLFYFEAALLVEGHVVVSAVKNHFVAVVDPCNLFEYLDDFESEVLAALALVDDDVLDVANLAERP